jgi:hypothetical protein
MSKRDMGTDAFIRAEKPVPTIEVLPEAEACSGPDRARARTCNSESQLASLRRHGKRTEADGVEDAA